jgi:hypothetical protein
MMGAQNNIKVFFVVVVVVRGSDSYHHMVFLQLVIQMLHYRYDVAGV